MAARPKICDRSLAGIAGSNPTVAWTSVSCECCALSGKGLCDGLRGPTECDLSEGDREDPTMTRPWPTGGCRQRHKVFG